MTMCPLLDRLLPEGICPGLEEHGSFVEARLGAEKLHVDNITVITDSTVVEKHFSVFGH